MKNSLKIVVLLAFMITSTKVLAKNKDFKVSFGKVAFKTFNFKLSNAENVSLYVYDANNSELFSDKVVTQNNVSKSYDMETLSSGVYYLVAESDQKIEKYKISIDESKMRVENIPVSVINKPEYTVNGNFVTLHISNLNEACKIIVSDLAENVFYQEKKNPINGELTIKFNLNPENSKSYLFTVEKDGNYFSKMITVK